MFWCTISLILIEEVYNTFLNIYDLISRHNTYYKIKSITIAIITNFTLEFFLSI